ncbi:MAG: MobF family relaxase [Solirubrobacterales bacterium]
MLTIGKLGKGQEAYYLDTVANGIEDYYAGEGEAPGRWTGGGTAELGLDGEVSRHELKAVLAGEDPDSGAQLPRRLWKRRVPGFDLTFSAPKSVSVVWATGEERTAAAIRDAHQRSVEAALSYLEREAAVSRVGAARRAAKGSGFVGAAFRHRMSRAGDPQLHTHVVVANLVRTGDGEWRALDAQMLYRRAKTAGYLYQAHLRHELTCTLALEWREVHRGTAEIAGVPDETLRSFSRRRAEIEAKLKEMGGASRRSRELAALTSRKAKDYRVAAADMRAEWRARARETGFEPELALRRGRQRAQRLSQRRLFAQTEAALTAERSTFARRHLLGELASQNRQGATVADIECAANRLLERTDIVELGDARPAGAGPEASRETLYTTREVLGLEERLIGRAIRHANRRLATASEAAVEAALRRDPALDREQRELVRRLALGGEGTVSVVGRAGAGKTRALRPVRDAFEASGIRVIGASPQNTAARILEAEAGIPSTSLTWLLYEAEVYGVPRGGVVVLDEAAVASTRAIARLQELCARDEAKLVLIGDPEQLPAIEHPGAFRALADRLDAVELQEVRRLNDPIERQAVELVRSGRGSAAISAYAERERLTFCDGVADLELRAAEDRHLAARSGEDAIVLARTRARTERLNALAQALREQDGELGRTAVEVGESRIRVGDRVVTRVNRRGTEPVYNRERWIVEALDPARRELTLRHASERGRVLTLGSDYLDRTAPGGAAAVELGYAITRYGAQGMTVDRAFCVLSDGLTREEAYTALTRARNGTELYAVAREPLERAEIAPQRPERRVDIEELGRQAERSEGAATALDERLRAELERRSTQELVTELRRAEQAAQSPASRRHESLAAARRDAERDPERARATAQGASHAERARLTAIARQAKSRAAELRSQAEAAERQIDASQPDRGRAAAIERILSTRRRLRTEAAIRLEPRYIVDGLGPRPEPLSKRLEWERAVDRLERRRQHLGITDRERALGEEPDAGVRAEWRAGQRELQRFRDRFRQREVEWRLEHELEHEQVLELAIER